MVSDDRIQDQNRWWGDSTAIERDPHILRFEQSPVRWDPPALTDIPLRHGDLNTLRGPRQVGKTTTAKRMIRQLLSKGETRILYYSFDVDDDNAAIADVIRRAKALKSAGDGPWYLFLDEVTAIPEWQRGIKYAWDVGMISQDFVLCTGSSARRMGTEQLPGRRGKGRNYLQLTLSFRDFCRTVRGIDLPQETLSIAEFLNAKRHDAIKHYYTHFAELDAALATYRKIGGFPAAVADFVRTGVVSPETIAMTWSMISYEKQQARLDPAAALKLIERVGISLGSTLSWQSVAEAMGAGSHHTAQDYVLALAQSFALMVVYYWNATGGFEPRKQRKAYFIDPLLAQVSASILPGARRPNEDGMIENLVATALFRSASELITQSDTSLGALGYWRSSQGREIDFVVSAPAGDERADRIPIEVKGDADTELRNAAFSLQRSFGRGILATRRTFDLENPDIPRIPIAVLLATLGERAERRLSTL